MRPNGKTIQQGMTLIELMVSIAIGAIILAGVVNLYLSSSTTYTVQQADARIQESARYAFGRIHMDIAQSGYLGCFRFREDLVVNTLRQETGNGQLYDFSLPLEASNNVGFMSSDIVSFRYAQLSSKIQLLDRSTPTAPLLIDDSDSDYISLERNQIAIVSDCSRASIFMITNDPQTSAGVIQHNDTSLDANGQGNISDDLGNTYGISPGNEIMGGSTAYLYTGTGGAHRYSINTSAYGLNVGGGCAPNSPQFCALYRDDEEIAQGIENFQLQVGWTDSAGNVRFDDPNAAVEWDTLDRVRIALSINSIERVPGSQGPELKTKLFSRTIMLRNQL